MTPETPIDRELWIYVVHRIAEFIGQVAEEGLEVQDYDEVFGTLYDLSQSTYVEFTIGGEDGDYEWDAEEFPNLKDSEVQNYLFMLDGIPIHGFQRGRGTVEEKAFNNIDTDYHDEFVKMNAWIKDILETDFGMDRECLESLVGLGDKSSVKATVEHVFQHQIDQEVEAFREEMNDTLDKILGGGDTQ